MSLFHLIVRKQGTLAAAIMISAAIRLAAQSSSSEYPPTPYEDPGACPFEGCVYREWTANDAVDVRTDRDHGAPIAFRVAKGDKVNALTGVVITRIPGRVQFRQEEDLSGTDGAFHIVPGETLYMLTYHGEGFMKVWFKGRVYDNVNTMQFYNGVCDFDASRCTGSILQRTESEWWIQIRNAAGQVGWTDEPRKFDGTDALAGR